MTVAGTTGSKDECDKLTVTLAVLHLFRRRRQIIVFYLLFFRFYFASGYVELAHFARILRPVACERAACCAHCPFCCNAIAENLFAATAAAAPPGGR